MVDETTIHAIFNITCLAGKYQLIFFLVHKCGASLHIYECRLLLYLDTDSASLRLLFYLGADYFLDSRNNSYHLSGVYI